MKMKYSGYIRAVLFLTRILNGLYVNIDNIIAYNNFIH